MHKIERFFFSDLKPFSPKERFLNWKINPNENENKRFKNVKKKTIFLTKQNVFLTYA